MMKRMLAATLVVLMTLLAITACTMQTAGTPGPQNPSDADTDKNVVTVSGKGEIKLTPDIATFTAGVRVEKKTAVDAQFENSAVMERIIQKLIESGVEEKDIQTSHMRLNEVYDYSKKNPTIKGFEVYNSLDITVRNLDKLGQILSDVIAAGATDANSIVLSIDDKEGAYNDALSAAIENAFSKAQAIAQASGGGLSALPLRITESYSDYSARSISPEAVRATEDTNQTVPVTIAEGELSIIAHITVEFELVPAS